LGQVSENSSKPSSNEHWRVFHEDVSWSYFVHDARHLGPESRPGTGDAGALSGCADVLARKSTAHDIDVPAPRFPVEGSHIVPDWEAWQDSVSLALQECSSAVWLDLHSAHGAMSEKHSAEDSSPCSSKKV
jgi:hypothetical protein